MSRARMLILAGAAVLAAVFIVFVAAGVREKPEPRLPAPTPTATRTPEPTPRPAGRGLAVGVTEFNANLIAAPGGRPLPSSWDGVRDALGGIAPRFYRLVVDWSAIQPEAGRPPDLGVFHDGCNRGAPPCLPWAGLRDQLRALASRQRAGGGADGWDALVVITWTPDWAAARAHGCERNDTPARARPPRPGALADYRRLVAALVDAAAQEGATLRYWSAWNEPNHPGFLSPQRERCDASARSAAPAAYAKIVRALQQALADAPGDQQLVLGETAGLLKRTSLVTSVPEFIAGLPKDVVCASRIWTQHAYIGGPDPAPAAARALDARGCPHRHTLWITETGVGPAPKGLSAANAVGNPEQGCRALHRRLLRWWRNPRVTAAFQYTVREDPAFPTGLVSGDLQHRRPALAEWQAWGGDRDPAAPPPPSTCGD